MATKQAPQFLLTASVIGLLCAACSSEVGSPPYQTTLGDSVRSNFQAQLESRQFLSAAEEGEVLQLSEKFQSEVPNLVYFEFDDTRLLPEATQSLQQQVEWLKGNPRAAVRIFGHTDKVGDPAYNEQLGLRRAQAVARFLQSNGVSPNRIQTVASRGENEPAVKTSSREILNRRTLTAVVGLSENDGPMRVARLFDGRRAVLTYERYATDQVTQPEAVGTTSF